MLRNRILAAGLIFFIILVAVKSFAAGEFTYDAKGRRNPFTPLVTADGRLLKSGAEE